MDKTRIGAAVLFVAARLKEPSTWAGVAVFIGMFGLSSGTVERILYSGPTIAAAIFSLVAILMPDAKKLVVVEAPDQEAE